MAAPKVVQAEPASLLHSKVGRLVNVGPELTRCGSVIQALDRGERNARNCSTAIAAIYLFASLLALAPRKAGYSHIKHSIARSVRSLRPISVLLPLASPPIGLALLLVAYLARPDSPAGQLSRSASQLVTRCGQRFPATLVPFVRYGAPNSPQSCRCG